MLNLNHRTAKGVYWGILLVGCVALVLLASAIGGGRNSSAHKVMTNKIASRSDETGVFDGVDLTLLKSEISATVARYGTADASLATVTRTTVAAYYGAIGESQSPPDERVALVVDVKGQYSGQNLTGPDEKSSSIPRGPYLEIIGTLDGSTFHGFGGGLLTKPTSLTGLGPSATLDFAS